MKSFFLIAYYDVLDFLVLSRISLENNAQIFGLECFFFFFNLREKKNAVQPFIQIFFLHCGKTFHMSLLGKQMSYSFGKIKK